MSFFFFLFFFWAVIIILIKREASGQYRRPRLPPITSIRQRKNENWETIQLFAFYFFSGVVLCFDFYSATWTVVFYFVNPCHFYFSTSNYKISLLTRMFIVASKFNSSKVSSCYGYHHKVTRAMAMLQAWTTSDGVGCFNSTERVWCPHCLQASICSCKSANRYSRSSAIPLELREHDCLDSFHFKCLFETSQKKHFWKHEMDRMALNQWICWVWICTGCDFSLHRGLV